MKISNSIKILVVFTVISLLTVSSLPSHTLANPSNSNVVISEVFYDTPGSDASEEWLELYNPSASSININGWTISDNTGSTTLPDVTLAPGDYFILARDTTGFYNLYGFNPDDGTMTISLNNGGDQLLLADNSGNPVDFVAWEGGYSNSYPSWTVSASYTSIYRLVDGSGFPTDTDSNSDWADSGTTGSPGSGYSAISGDTQAPSVTFTNPADGNTVSQTVNVACNATDNSGTVSSSSLTIDGSQVTSASGGSLQYTWDTTSVVDGSHTLHCEATDSSSNTGSVDITVSVDNRPASDLFKVYFTDPLAGLPQMTNFAAQQGNISTGIVSLINAANSTIDAALYHLTWQPVIDALNAANSRGVQIRVAYHGDNSAEFSALDAGIATTAVTTSYTMHNKFFIVDGNYVFTGSWNPTETGTLYNANDGLRVESSTVASIYTAEFEQLFANTYANSKVDNNAEMATVGETQVEIYFSPVDDGLTRLISLIDGSQTTIHLSLFYLTEDSIYNALVNALNRGVVVKLVADYRGWHNAYSEADELIALGAGVVDANPGVYHHKFGVFDGQIVWVGSTNWSNSGFNSNDENSMVIHDAGIAQHYLTRTMQFWNDAMNYDQSPSQAPRIVTHHYSSWLYSNMVSWRLRLDGNTPIDGPEQYLLWRWNSAQSNWQMIRELSWGSGYYPDFNVTTGTTYYYCLTSLAADGTQSDCSAEFAAQVNNDGTNYQPVLYPATGHLAAFGSDTTAPVPTIRQPLSTTVSGYQDIYFTVDDLSYISNYAILIDGVVQTSSSRLLWDTTTFSDGSHTIEVQATDIFGNTGSSSLSVTVDNSAFVDPQQDYTGVKIMTYNINAYDLQTSGAVDFRTGQGSLPFLAVLKEENADIMILEETGGLEQFGNATLNRISADLNSYYGSSEVPYSCVTTAGEVAGYGGITVCSRFPIVDTQQIITVDLDNGSTELPSHDFLDATVLIGSSTIHLIGAHLKASSGASNEAQRERAQEGLLNYMDGLGASANIVYAGDMNSYAPNEPCVVGTSGGCDLGYGPMNMTLNPNHPKTSVTHDFYNAYRTANPDTGTSPGYTYTSSAYGDSVIDYLTVNDVNNNGLYQYITGATAGDTASASTGSDHFSVDATFDLSMWQPADTTAPSQVTGLQVTAVSDSQIDLSWNANPEADLDHYNIYRDGVFLTQISTNSFSDTGLNANTSYDYQVSAVDTSSNEGILSTTKTAITQSGNTGVNHILISEVMYDVPGSDAKGEWIELYNPTTASVDLSGWSLADNSRSFSLPSGTIIQAGDYLVVARDTTGFFNLYGFNPDVSGLTLALSNSGDEVSLHNSTGSTVDYVAWEQYTTGWDITASTGQTIARSTLNSDTDTVTDWTVLSNNGTPGA